MTQYTVTITGYESGLTTSTVDQQFREQLGGPDKHIDTIQTDDTTYRVVIDGIESGLSQSAIEYMYRDQFPGCNVLVQTE